jgi:cell division protein FtsI (penicillin-binding protein 3)
MFEKRKKLFLFIFFIFSFIHLMIVFKIQFFDQNTLDDLTKKQYLKHLVIESPRKCIYDCNNLLLAGNIKKYFLYCSPKELIKYPELKNKILLIFPDINKTALEDKNKEFLYLKKNLSYEEIQNIINKDSSIRQFMHIGEEYKRYYPNSCMNSIIGFTGDNNEGISGVEYSFNQFLKSEFEKKYLFCNAKKETYEEINPKTFCNKLILSINSKLQSILFDFLKEQAIKFGSTEAYIVIMDGNTGKIDALVMYPFLENLETLKETNSYLLQHHAITSAYEMGSVMKAFCMLACLDEKTVTPETIIDCKSSKTAYINGVKVNTWKAHGEITYHDVIKYSNNIGTVQPALEIGKKLFDHYKKLGFGEKTNIELPGEALGFINNPKNWSKLSIYSMSYGYEVMTSLIQLIRAWSVFVNNGFILNPSILHYSKISKTNILYPKETIQKARSILRHDNDKYPKLFKNLSNYNIFGKTGTAELLENGIYNKAKNSYSFIGHIEKENHKKIIGIYMKENKYINKYSSEVAFPLFCQIGELLISTHNLDYKTNI